MPTATEKLATIEDVSTLVHDRTCGLKHYSTAEEYFKAGSEKESAFSNDAVKHIEAGREPFLVDLDSVDMGLHPFIAIHDVMVKPDQIGKIGLVTNHTVLYVSRNTLLAWK